MYVCVCKGITCGQIRAAVAEGEVSHVRDLSRQYGLATQCGKCAQCARGIVDESLQQQTKPGR